MGIFSKILFGSNAGLSNRELRAMTYRNKFSEYLPYIAYDRETKAYLNTDNTIGFIWEASPLCFAGEKTSKTLQCLFRIGFPEGSIIQFILYADKYIDPYIKAYKEGKTRDDPLIKSTTEEFCRYLMDGADGLKGLSGIPIRNYRLFVTAKIPVRDKIDITEIHATIEENLRGANLNPGSLMPEDLLDWMRRFFNDTPSLNNREYDEEIPIRKQIIKSETEIKKSISHIQIGKSIYRCTTPKRLPKEVDLLQTNQLSGGIWGMTSDTDQIRTPFIHTINIIFHNLKSKLHTKCNMVLQQQGVGSFAPSLMRKKEEYLWAVDELEKGTRFVRIIPVLWVWGNSEAIVSEAITRAKRIWELQGYIMQEDRGILPILLIASLPFGLYDKGSNIDNLDRDFIAPSDSITSILPVQSDLAGGGRPVLLFIFGLYNNPLTLYVETIFTPLSLI